MAGHNKARRRDFGLDQRARIIFRKVSVFVSGLHEEHSDHGSVCGHDRGGTLTGSKHNGVRGMKNMLKHEKYRTIHSS